MIEFEDRTVQSDVELTDKQKEQIKNIFEQIVSIEGRGLTKEEYSIFQLECSSFSIFMDKEIGDIYQCLSMEDRQYFTWISETSIVRTIMNSQYDQPSSFIVEGQFPSSLISFAFDIHISWELRKIAVFKYLESTIKGKN